MKQATKLVTVDEMFVEHAVRYKQRRCTKFWQLSCLSHFVTCHPTHNIAWNTKQSLTNWRIN